MTTTVEAPLSPAEDYADALAFEAPYLSKSSSRIM